MNYYRNIANLRATEKGEIIYAIKKLLSEISAEVTKHMLNRNIQKIIYSSIILKAQFHHSPVQKIFMKHDQEKRAMHIVQGA